MTDRLGPLLLGLILALGLGLQVVVRTLALPPPAAAASTAEGAPRPALLLPDGPQEAKQDPADTKVMD